MIDKKDIKILKNIILNDKEIEICKKISENTLNTWQSRNFDEILKDTILGKIAEKALINEFIKNNMFFDSYDNFRNDNFKKHNGIDMIVALNQNSLDKSKKIILSNLNEEDKLKYLMNFNTKIIEIKSTRISKRFFLNNSINLDYFLKDDFLEYPSHLRKGNINNENEYFNLIINSKYNNIPKELAIDFIKKDQEKKMSDYYFRIYVDQDKENIYKGNAYIIGVCHKSNFINNFKIKKMVQSGKSENPIYLYYPLKNGYTLDMFYKKINQKKIENKNTLN